uniref:Pro-Pol polyprotein n=2 Tax=Cajanus cajan TaxID=3821 RepID=A0A151T9J5_CAJCA|nr:Pro-Pol polyprotein [Cajanus cajan]
MPGIDADFICHRLAIHKEAKSVAQRKRKVDGKRRETIITEAQKLLNVGFVREVRYTTWLANVVLVKKSSGKWRMCVDYTNLNKACPKDSYPLPSIDRLITSDHHDKVVNTSNNEDQGWMTGIWSYLKEGVLPEDKDEARKMRVRSAKFVSIGDELFKHGISTPLLKCLTAPQAAYVIEEIHRGICVMHAGARSMAARVLRAGYYWPTLKSDCQDYVQRCPPETLHQMMSSWPFSRWGMDILGPFPPAKGQLKFLLVAIDYFTKWIEAYPLAKITTKNVQRFTWRNIVCRFGIPHTLVTDNDRQFIAQGFEDFLRELGIKHLPTLVEHPQTNGQAEAANKVILRELKKQLGNAKGQWANELPNILWAYHCTPQSTTQETSYMLTYGADGMIPVEIGETSHRRQVFNSQQNAQELAADLDLVDELREETQMHEEACKL